MRNRFEEAWREGSSPTVEPVSVHARVSVCVCERDRSKCRCAMWAGVQVLICGDDRTDEPAGCG